MGPRGGSCKHASTRRVRPPLIGCGVRGGAPRCQPHALNGARPANRKARKPRWHQAGADPQRIRGRACWGRREPQPDRCPPAPSTRPSTALTETIAVGTPSAVHHPPTLATTAWVIGSETAVAPARWIWLSPPKAPTGNSARLTGLMTRSASRPCSNRSRTRRSNLRPPWIGGLVRVSSKVVRR